MNATAPLLGVLALLGLNWLFTILFIDAVVAPLGTTNVYIAVTSRILYSVGKEFVPQSILTRINKNNAPVAALWINAGIGIIFLLQFPTWAQLVNFLSSIVVFGYLAGPISILVLGKEQSLLPNSFKLPYPNLIGILGFICCSWLIYWSGLSNLGYLIITAAVVSGGYCFFSATANNIRNIFINNWYLLFYLVCLWVISLLRAQQIVSFPFDNLVVAGIGCLFSQVFVYYRLSRDEIKQKILILTEEYHAVRGSKS
jgi:amino acid transporter